MLISNYISLTFIRDRQKLSRYLPPTISAFVFSLRIRKFMLIFCDIFDESAFALTPAKPWARNNDHILRVSFSLKLAHLKLK